MMKMQAEKRSGLPRFTFKGSLFLLTAMLLATLVFPVILDSLGLKLYTLRVVVIALTSGLATAFTLFFIDSKRGATRKFWITAGFISILAGIIAYFWIYQSLFI
ncbi:hypothetical protein G7059_04765 [Erysipelothrix sp. HDW6A]|uniref:hypothetical protein n=1 Tax=Erysipelothrix sp. HDW6A TaxID=2714928 RepID=UPI00140B8B63|nr:hypothetical protein [Erysipelothrix sp. HDW6A]QIK57208.1 hypothetical protein G7059_04765 [Erysipelothrix sp. HDW6A]